MNTIIITTDFSIPARNATLTGLKLARMLNSKVIFFHVCEFEASQHDGEPDEEECIKLKQTELELELHRFQEVDLLNTSARVASGLVAEEIIKIASSTRDCMLVMGTRGHTNNFDALLGSDSIHVLLNADFPLLLVPQEFYTEKFTCCALATDLGDLKTRTITQIGNFISLTKMILKVVNIRSVNTGLRVKQVVAGFELDESLEGPGYERDFIDEAEENVPDSLIAFVEKHNADILISLHRHSDFLKNLFFPPVMTAETRQLATPLLIFPHR
jgi:nucleotide-binding universal stress UspA family protein